ncbi:hypothetical protein GOBAR_AA17724 [Gossypium barbadense]|uniref:Uncharacterized protein n=1 Tax=Gossypium barbadense TaxID=3634 RepID=A0A2P5XI02_GOSBA|nr:hypothetical protein GOBAR_AA17724 [Gossypium barbadense]
MKLKTHIHPVVIETNAHGEDRFDKNCRFNHEGEDFSDPDVDDIPDDIENEGANDENDYTPSFRNPSHGIVICNNLEAYVSIIDPDRKHASDFLEYLDIIPAHMMLADSESKKLFMGGAIVGSSRHFDTRVPPSSQHVLMPPLMPPSMSNNLLMYCTHWNAHCLFGETSS